MHMNAALRTAAVVHGDGPALIHAGTRQDWRQTLERVARRAARLRDAGLRPGEHVATLALNAAAHLECLLAVWWAGGVLVPINTRLAYEEMRHILRHGDVKLLATDAAHAETGRRAVRDAATLLGHLELSDEAHGAGMSPIDSAPSSLAGVFYTGGTTGLPKGVELTHDNFLFSALTLQREMRLDEESVYLHAAPLFHLADFSIGLATTLAGGSHSFLPQFTPAEFYRRLREDDVTHLNLVPTMLAAVLDAPERDDALLRRVRCVAYGAAPIQESLLSRLIEACPDAHIHQFYGMTESCGASITLQPQWHVVDGPRAGRLRAAGQPVSGVEIRIADGQLRELPHGATGEIIVRGPCVMRGYWQDPARSSEALSDGWLRTGDIGCMDAQGFVYVVDRLKDMIISGGENIYCAEVENALSAHPGVAACAVVGIPDDRWGERVHAAIVAREGAVLSPELLDAHCRTVIAGYKVPRSYEFRSEPLPLSAVGKVRKDRLREQWLEARRSQA